MTYIPPVEVFFNHMVKQIQQQTEDTICTKIIEQIGVEVDKEEMLKCLQYDRAQYEKGFADARKQFERPTAIWVDTDEYPIRWECSNCNTRYPHLYNFCPFCGAYTQPEETEINE